MLEPRTTRATSQGATWLLSLTAALGCATTTSTGNVSTKGIPLSQVMATSDVPRAAVPAPDMMATIVFATQTSEQRPALIEKFRQWCRDSSGAVVQKPQAVDCANRDAPRAGCFAGAAGWYHTTHPRIAYYHEVCADQEGAVSAALLTTSREGVPGGTVAVYERADAVAFVRHYLALYDASNAASAAEEAERERSEQRDFEAAIAKLDGQSDPTLRGAATARESIDFIREMLRDSGFRNLGAFTKAPCLFKAHAESENPTEIDLSKLDLGVLDALAERHVDWHGQTLTAYQIVLKVDGTTAHSEYKTPDAAKRSARAFQALARRCGAKTDNRFR
jgi:hypothetical protein